MRRAVHPGPARVLAIAAALAAAVTPPADLAARGSDGVYPVAPPDQAVVDARPVFFVGLPRVADEQLRELRLRITLEAQDSGGRDRVFDQREQPSGWVPGDTGQMLYRPRRPLPDGSYVWRPWLWDGVAWIPSADRRRLRIDTVAPADVAELDLRWSTADGSLRLRWAPVTTDRQGAAEYVARYHVYRYADDPDRPLVRPFRIGTSVTPEFVDPSPPRGAGILFYRVVAEDLAGNVAGVRR